MNHSALQQRARALCAPLTPLPIEQPVFARTRPCREVLQNCRAVLCDVYGTLLISGSGDVGPATTEDNEQAWREAMAEAGLAPPPDAVGTALLRAGIEAFQQRRRAEGVEYPEVDILAVWRDVLARLDIAGLTQAQVETLAIGYECRVNPVWPMPGMAEVLTGIRDAGLAMGIVSNAQFITPLLFPALAGAGHTELGFSEDLCVWSYRQLEGKPSSALFARVLRALENKHGITAAETLYVGNDRLKDVWPAASVGMRTALFAGDRRSLRLRESDSRCNDVTPNAVITSLAQLHDMLAPGTATS